MGEEPAFNDELLLHGGTVGAVLLLFLGELLEAFPFLTQPFLQLLLLLQQGSDAALQLLTATAAAPRPWIAYVMKLSEPASPSLHVSRSWGRYCTDADAADAHPSTRA